MKIELYINGEFAERWFYDDIRAADYSDEGIRKCEVKIHDLIEQIKGELNMKMKNYIYVFYTVYQSNLNIWNYSESDIEKFNRQINKAS